MDTGACDCGISVSNSTQIGSGGFHPGFGATADGHWVIGTLNSTAVGSLHVTEFISGFSWLVRAGKNVANNGSYVAPRTAIGTTPEGHLLMLEVDGCEPARGCKGDLGKTESAMAELLLQNGAFHAINLDGGGSSTTVKKGKVINRPTDTDHWAIRR